MKTHVYDKSKRLRPKETYEADFTNVPPSLEDYYLMLMEDGLSHEKAQDRVWDKMEELKWDYKVEEAYERHEEETQGGSY